MAIAATLLHLGDHGRKIARKYIFFVSVKPLTILYWHHDFALLKFIYIIIYFSTARRAMAYQIIGLRVQSIFSDMKTFLLLYLTASFLSKDEASMCSTLLGVIRLSRWRRLLHHSVSVRFPHGGSFKGAVFDGGKCRIQHARDPKMAAAFSIWRRVNVRKAHHPLFTDSSKHHSIIGTLSDRIFFQYGDARDICGQKTIS